MALSFWTALLLLAGAAPQLPPVAAPHLDRDDVAVIQAALTASAGADVERFGGKGELLVLDETVVFCSSRHGVQVACVPESVDLPSGPRTAVPLPVPPLPIARTRTVAHAAVADVFRLAAPDQGWIAFHARFPNALGYAGVSAPAYDAGAARVYVTFVYGSLGAKGWLVRLSREGVGWRVTKTTLIWIS